MSFSTHLKKGFECNFESSKENLIIVIFMELKKQTILEPNLWVKRYADVMLNFAFRKTSDLNLSEDLVQETFLSVLTGIAIYKPVQFGWLVALFGGYELARIIHFALTVGYCLFFLIHIAQVIKAGWNNFQAMVTGIEIKTIKPLNEAKDEQ
jgi:hypothetical protein